ncbi:hypothetical protein PVMG_05925 [Plasmodium vivax Mauritania I]|uniref:Variable surface protein Vir35 n=1 Tax=Plasmodium vivax Mauritania I TaxID=1035515 RepID=A0A0J9T2J8_PLAVI|nr:hypothetical protein PVMG_05925 [Plasmodium vivax Mauritania I]
MKLLENNNIKNRGIVSKNIEMKFRHEGLLNKSNNRLLAKHETQKNLKCPHLRDKLSDDVNNMNLKYRMNNSSKHDLLNKKKLNDLDAYKKGYKNRYSKKKGLAKLECYYEKKLFDQIDGIYELSRSMQNDKKKLKKKIYNKFGHRLILFAISPIFGVIFPILFNKNSPILKYCSSDCPKDTDDLHQHDDLTGDYLRTSLSQTHWNIIISLHTLFFFTLLIIVLTVIIYTLIKVMKYERLKAGKKKIKGKDYYRFCKSVFT